MPRDLIAQAPAGPRDAARLLVYDTRTNRITFDRFRNLAKYLPEQSLLILNRTRVVPARVVLRKPAGGKVVALFLVNESAEDERKVRVLLDRGVPAGSTLRFPNGETQRKANSGFLGTRHGAQCRVIGQEKNIFTLELPFKREVLIQVLEKVGATPIPPYIKRTPLSERELRQKYQTIFANVRSSEAESSKPVNSNVLKNIRINSVAAPTAALHFTDRVFRSLERQNIERAFLTLHVGLGTFAPITAANIRTKRLHEEWFEISAEVACAVSKAKNEGRPIVAVGTTVVRALESAAFTQRGKLFLQSGFQNTDIFIRPPHRFLVPDALVTNFHVPRSSLMMLVEAFLRHKRARRGILDLYKIAIREQFRFFSFGDAMLIR